MVSDRNVDIMVLDRNVMAIIVSDRNVVDIIDFDRKVMDIIVSTEMCIFYVFLEKYCGYLY